MPPQAATDLKRPLQGEALVDDTDAVWLPCDLPHLPAARVAPDRWTGLSARRDVRHAGRRPFRWHLPPNGELHVINGMGITLGDSVIGMNALAWLKARHPALRIHVHRTPHASPTLERLYQLADPCIATVSYLPRRLDALPRDVVDLSDFLHWPAFATEPMVDFFLRGLGIAPNSVPASAKCNRWLAGLPLPSLQAAWAHRPYVLLCDRASTPLRSVPPRHAATLAEQVWRRYGLPVLGFHPIAHPRFHDVSASSRTLDAYLAWVAGACAVVGTDSSAIHLAAGFDVPTLAVFTSIDPALRVRDYSHCHAVDLRTIRTDGLHESADPRVLRDVDATWASHLAQADWPWPRIARGRRLRRDND